MDKHKILVVDDEKEFADLIAFQLKAAGYEAIAAYDGTEVLEKAKSEKPNLILLDIMMPVMDGLAILRRLKGDPNTEHIRVIMVTAKTDSDMILKAQNMGSVDYVMKPVKIAELLELVKQYI